LALNNNNLSILLLGLFVALLLLFNPSFVSHESYANTGAMGGSKSSSSKTHQKDDNDGNNTPKQLSKTHQKDDNNHGSGGNDNNDGFPSPATTDDTSTQQTCLGGLAPLTASAICGSSQTPTDNIPSSPTGDLVTAGNPPAGVNCVASDECVEPPTTSTSPTTSTPATHSQKVQGEDDEDYYKRKYLEAISQAQADKERLKNAAVAGGVGAGIAGTAAAAGAAELAGAAKLAALEASIATSEGSIAAYYAAFEAGAYLAPEAAAAAGAAAGAGATEAAGAAAGAAVLGSSLILPVAILGGIAAAALCYWYC
jgi:hypothetical protein